MSPLAREVLRSIRRRQLLSNESRVLVAVSGGGDSVALLHLLVELAGELALSLLVASVDHGLRAESSAEVESVGKIAERLSLPFVPLRLELGEAGNVQSRARQARYRVLLAEAAKWGAGRVALGHTRDDHAETVLSRICRGAGVRGIGGIQPLRDDGVVRPLIDVRRAALRSYLRGRGFVWAEDPSNESARFERVRIRRLLMQLEQEDPQLHAHIAHLADDARASEEALLALATNVGSDLSSLAAAPEAVRRRALRRLAEEHIEGGLRRRHLEDLEALVLTGKGEVLLGRGWRAREMHGCLRFEQGDWGGRSH